MLNAVLKPSDQRLSGPLSKRIREMRGLFMHLQFSETGMTREDVERITGELKTMSDDAAQLERPVPRMVPVTNPAVPGAFELLSEAEATIGSVRSELLNRMRCEELDPSAKLQASLADVTARIMRAQDMIRENTGELAS